MNPHARMPGYLTQPFCGKHCCHNIPTRNPHHSKRVAKRIIKRREERAWKREH